MKVLIVSSDFRTINNLSNFLRFRKIESETILFDSLSNFTKAVDEHKENVNAIVFDRIYFNLNNCLDSLKDFDCFWIVEDFKKIDQLGDFDEEITLRFYRWPLNYNLLIDDLKSITRLKEYMDFGNIDLEGINLNLNNRSLSDGIQEIMLKNKEYELLLYLAKNRGKVLSRVNILENVWDMNSNVMTNTVDVHVSKIRQILKNNFGINGLIRTVSCAGYILT